ncbi:ComEC/Rec2 family competence protein [Neoactinobaculum massilliense]|uniref:ComEC/Rec2 family competence protein n=1 Tax=Neoactinobaculum massilliense TaxID=2364794 RepID=UPI0013DDC3D5|nr:ComEC/Rec2 family competence protein [Neoactinobaculum massilliense]
MVAAVCLLAGLVPRLRTQAAVSAGAAGLAAIAALGATWAARPPDLIALDGRYVDISGTVMTRVVERQLPWGEVECTAQIRPSRVDGGSSEFGWRVRLQVTVPCDTLRGDAVSGRGRLRVSDPNHRETGRINLANPRIVRHQAVTAQIVARLSEALSTVLEPFPDHARALIPGVALGDDSQVPDSLRTAMQSTSLTHLIAVSGGHVAIVTGVAITLVGRRHRRLAAACAALAVVALVILVGPEPSVLRAALMGGLIVMAVGTGRPSGSAPALAVAVIGMTLLSPWTALSYGFLLSVLATMGIVLVGVPMGAAVRGSIPRIIAEPVAMSLAAQLFCMPVLALFTDQSSLWSVLANVAIAPAVAPLTITGLGATLLAPACPWAAHLLLIPASICTAWIADVASFCAAMPGSGVSLGVATLGLITGGILLLVLPSRWLWGVGAIVGATMSVFALLPGGGGIPSNWDAVQCDVGQGAALLLRAEGRTVMIDVGPEGDAAVRCLRSAGVTRIDILVLTHWHADHVGGLSAVLDQATVGEVWTSGNAEPQAASRAALREFRRRHIPVTEAHAGAEARVGDTALLRVIWPDHPRGDEASANDDALVLRSDVAGGILVFSDSGEEVQDRLYGVLGPVRSVIVAHHGSADQSARVAALLSPEITVVSVGENNYGHPAPIVARIYPHYRATLDCGAIWWAGGSVGAQRCETG